MKKILILVSVLALLSAIFSGQILSFFDPNKQEVLAKVNGEKITYSDIESLYDMRYAHTSITPPSVVELQLEYAELLYKRIEQILISQELEVRGLSVDDERVNAFEDIVRKDYENADEDIEESFIEIVEESGISYPFWKSQLRVRLEVETLQADISKSILVSSEEILQYVKTHPELSNMPDRLDFVVLKSPKKSQLDEIKSKNVYKYNELSKLGIKIERGLFDLSQVPEKYLEDLKQMEVATFSDVKGQKDNFYLLYLNEYEKNKNPEALRLYAIAEQELLEAKIPVAFDKWFLSALESAEITIVEDFLPSELPDRDLSQGIQSILKENSNSPQDKNSVNTESDEPDTDK